jgi:hypothetical protein
VWGGGASDEASELSLDETALVINNPAQLKDFFKPLRSISPIEHTPSWISSRGSYTEEGKISIYAIKFGDWEIYQSITEM